MAAGSSPCWFWLWIIIALVARSMIIVLEFQYCWSLHAAASTKQSRLMSEASWNFHSELYLCPTLSCLLHNALAHINLCSMYQGELSPFVWYIFFAKQPFSSIPAKYSHHPFSFCDTYFYVSTRTTQKLIMSNGVTYWITWHTDASGRQGRQGRQGRAK